jgi:hypothetical protein
MWAQIERIMSEATGRIVTSVAAFMPGVLALLTIMIVSCVVALIARQIVVKGLQGLEFDQRASQWGLSTFAEWSPTKSITMVVARGVQWTILVLGLLVGLTALDAAMPSRFALSVFDYLPHVVAALIVLVIGSIVAQFLSRAVLIGAVNMRIHSALGLSLAVKWMLLIVSASMALEQLGIGRQILLLAFGILFGGVVLATALAVGLGAKDAVGRAIERQLHDATRKAGDPIDHV